MRTFLSIHFIILFFSGHPWAQEKFPKRGDSSGEDIGWPGYTCKSATGWLCDLGQTALPLQVQQRRCCLNSPLDLVVCGFISLTRYAFWAGADKGRRKRYPGRQGLCLERKQGAQGRRKTEDQRASARSCNPDSSSAPRKNIYKQKGRWRNMKKRIIAKNFSAGSGMIKLKSYAKFCLKKQSTVWNFQRSWLLVRLQTDEHACFNF